MWRSGCRYIFDVTGSYRLAFLHGFLWTIVNLSPVTWLILLPKLRQRRQVATAR